MNCCPNLPSGVCEADVIHAINRTGDLLAKKFAFGQYGVDDIRSLIGLYTVEALAAGRYRPVLSIPSCTRTRRIDC